MRTGYNTSPFEKKMEVYQNFSGGLNTISAPDNMQDDELTDILNMDISERGSLKRRTGMVKAQTCTRAGTSQGYFRYFKTDGTYEEFFAISGGIVKVPNPLPETIQNLSSFQTTRPIEAVQLGPILYVATGTKLVQYDGTTWKVVDAYLPTTMEMMYIGTNALAADPLGHLQDTTGLVPSIDYVYATSPTGVINTYIQLKVFCTKISGESYEFATQIQKTTATTDFPDPATGSYKALDTGNIRYAPKVSTEGDYVIRVSMRKVGTTTILAQYDFQYTVKKVNTPKTSAAGTNTIHQCNRVLVHGQRLFLYGDPAQPALVYISQVSSPNYFPSLFTIEFENPKREPLTCIVPYRNGLLAFTKNSSQYLTGTSPDDYVRRILHTDIGCISPFGAAVTKNDVMFLSMQGVYAIRTVSYTDDKATVVKLDTKVANIVPLDTKAIAMFDNDQFQITFPSNQTRLRYYQELGAWTKDYSTNFTFTNMYIFDGHVYGLSGGNLYKFDDTSYTDDTYTYTNSFESKAFGLSQPYHQKKLKELQILLAPKGQTFNSSVQIYADEVIVEGGTVSYPSVDATTREVIWNEEWNPNLYVSAGTTFGDWSLGESAFGGANYAVKKFRIAGKCLRTKVVFINNMANENHVIGFAYIFKVRKP